MALRALHLPSTLRTVGQILSARPDPHGRRVYRLHDVEQFTLSAERPLSVQVDGDYIGDHDLVELGVEEDALRLLV